MWRLSEAAPSWASPLILLAGFAGLRWGEAVALRPDDLALEASEVHVERTFSAKTNSYGPPKSASSRRTAILSSSIRSELEAALARSVSDIAFPSPTGRVANHSNFRKQVWLPLIATAGLHGVRFHDLRHTYASTLISTGLNPAVVASVMGHSSAAVTLRVYAGFWESQLEDAKVKLNSMTARHNSP